MPGSEPAGLRRVKTFARQSACVSLTTAAHLAIGLLLVQRWTSAPEPPLPDPPAPVLIDMAALPAPEVQPDRRSLPAPASQAQSPARQVNPAPAWHDRFVLTDQPDAISLPESAWSEIRIEEAVGAPPPPSALRRPGEPTFEGLLLARLEQFRRYPAEAQRRRQQGVVRLRFRMDRDGHVLDATIAGSSGLPVLDREALATLHRAEPLPPIPADRPDTLEVLVPIEFLLKHAGEPLEQLAVR